MSEEAPKAETPEWWKSTLTAAWIDTRMEADRTVVTLAAGGVALLVTLLTTVGAPPRALKYYIGGFVCFMAAIFFGLAIFKVSARHLAEALADVEKADSSATRKLLRSLDWAMMISFVVGIAFSIGVAAQSQVENGRAQPAAVQAPNGRPHATKRTDTAKPAEPKRGGAPQSGGDHQPAAGAPKPHP